MIAIAESIKSYKTIVSPIRGPNHKRRIPKPNFITLVILELTSADLTVYEAYLNLRGAQSNFYDALLVIIMTAFVFTFLLLLGYLAFEFLKNVND